MRRRLYSTKKWARTRAEVLERDGWRCRACGRAGRLEVDHAVPIQAGGPVWEMGNLQALCRACHFSKTSAENRARKTVPAEVQAWDNFVIDQF